MQIRKIVVGTAVAGTLGAAALGLAGTASAGPGISIDPGTNGENAIGIGDQSKTGATAKATEGNTAFAVSVFAPATATVGGNAKGSTAGAIGISSPTGASSAITGDVKGGGAYTLDGNTTITGNANGTQVFNVYTKDITANGNAGATTTLAVCGTQVTAQAAHVTVSKGCN